jgi:hypothetical protein
MKLKFNSLLLIIFIGTISLNCKKESPEKENGFVFKGNTYQTPHGYTYSKFLTMESSIHYIAFTSPDLNYDSYNGFKGEGNLIVLTIISDDNKELLPGTYYCGKNLNPSAILNYNAGGKEVNYSSSASVPVKKATINALLKNKFEINYTLDFGNGNTFEGYYNGTFSSYNPFM